MTQIQLAKIEDENILLELATAFHEEDGHPLKNTSPRAIHTLLVGSQLGRIYLIKAREHVVGYFALCFTMSIEFGGVVTILDDLYITKSFRGQGIGKYVLEQISQLATEQKSVQLFLEVENHNKKARDFYEKSGFHIRDRNMMEKML